MDKVLTTSDAIRGGEFQGESHQGVNNGMRAVIVDNGNEPILVEGSEAIINKKAMNSPKKYTITGTTKQIVSTLNQKEGNGRAIGDSEAEILKIFNEGGTISSQKDVIYNEWKKLVNMSASELTIFYNSEEGKVAGLSNEESDKLGISNGRESSRWIVKMKRTPYSKWTNEMFVWAKKQISFIKRMSGNRGGLYDEDGEKTRKHTSLLIWGHNPEKNKVEFEKGGAIKKENDSFPTVTLKLFANNKFQRKSFEQEAYFDKENDKIKFIGIDTGSGSFRISWIKVKENTSGYFIDYEYFGGRVYIENYINVYNSNTIVEKLELGGEAESNKIDDSETDSITYFKGSRNSKYRRSGMVLKSSGNIFEIVFYQGEEGWEESSEFYKKTPIYARLKEVNGREVDGVLSYDEEDSIDIGASKNKDNLEWHIFHLLQKGDLYIHELNDNNVVIKTYHPRFNEDIRFAKGGTILNNSKDIQKFSKIDISDK